MRLIDADELIHTIEHDAFVSESVKSFVRRLVKGTPTVDSVKHGRWIEEKFIDGRMAQCSACGGWSTMPSRYCPNCGAKMDGENDETD